ncbi:MAG: DUF1501 domain-containing protein [Verrucomicrobiae bacterium]|nr:DUF1501 domain-containing protein [Verrucomicrobiae bacterium]
MRRDFLKLCGLASLGVAAPVGFPDIARADEQVPPPYDGPFYIVFNASGGWDTTYLMDPKGVGEVNRLYKQDDILTEGNIHFAPTAANIDQASGGLSNEEFFKRYGSELLVFNGLDYSVNNHAPCSRYMATGKLDSLAYPTFAALVAACRGPECPLAFLTFGNYSSTGNVVPMARVPYLPTLGRIANADCVEGNARSPYHDDFVNARIEAALKDQTDARISQTRLPRIERAQSMLYAAQLNSKALQRVTPFIPKENPKYRLQQQAEIALASFKAGVCVSANLSIGQFDSHANNDRDQMNLIPELLAGIDYTLRRADKLNLRDQLVVVMQSEMGRTPNYNKGDGKDHWSIGSIMFLGPGIQGNRVIGKTDDGQFLVPIDPLSLALVDDKDKGLIVRPEHIHLALREFAGIAEHPFSEKFPLVVPAEQRLQGFWG